MPTITEIDAEIRRREIDAEIESREPVPKADTWAYVFSEGGSLADVLPFTERRAYDEFMATTKDPEGFEDKLTSALYVADLMGLPAESMYTGTFGDQLAKELFKKEMTPGQVVSAAMQNEDAIQRFYNAAWEVRPKATAEQLKLTKAALAGELPDLPEETETIRRRVFSGLWEKTQAAWEQSADNVGVDFLYAKAADGIISEAEADKAAAEYNKLVREEPVKGRNWVQNLWLSTVGIARPMLSGTEQGIGYGLAAGGVALAAGQAGPQVALPEEIVTAPTAFGAGFTVGAVKYWSEQGRGSVFRQARQEGLSKKTAGYVSAVAGPLYGYVEFAQVNKLIPGIGKLPKTILKAALRMGTKAAQEITEEGVQKVVTEGAVTIGKLVEDKIDAADLPQETKNIAIEALREMKAAAGPLVVLGLPAGVAGVGRAALTQRQEKQVKASLAEMTASDALPDTQKLRILRISTAQGLITAEDASLMEEAVAEQQAQEEAAKPAEAPAKAPTLPVEARKPAEAAPAPVKPEGVEGVTEELKPELSSNEISNIARTLNTPPRTDDVMKGEIDALIGKLKSQGHTHIDIYHVTDVNPETLQQEGLKGTELSLIGETTGGLRPSSTYVFLDPFDAAQGIPGLTSLGETPDTNVVHARVPVERLHDMYWDSNFNVSFETYSSVRVEGGIPADDIVDVFRWTKPTPEDYAAGLRPKPTTRKVQPTPAAPEAAETTEQVRRFQERERDAARIARGQENEFFVRGQEQYDIDMAHDLSVDAPLETFAAETVPELRSAIIQKTEEGIVNADIRKPIILATTEQGSFVIDGHHRVEKAFREGKPIQGYVLSKKQTATVVSKIGEPSARERAAPAAAEAVEAKPAVEKAQTVKERYQKWYENLGKRLEREAIGQEILDEMIEQEVNAKEFNAHFWDNVYPQLPAKEQRRFERYVQGETGFKPGDVIAWDPKTKKEDIAKTWADVGKLAVDIEEAENLEGTERGLVALEAIANQWLQQKPTGEAKALPTLPPAAPEAVKPAPKAKAPVEKKAKEPTTLGPDVTGILGGVAREPAGLSKAEIEHLGKREQHALRAAQKKGLKVGYKQGAADTILDARRTMAALITKQKISIKDKMDLASIVLTYVPKEHQGRFINRILKLKTPKAARKLTETIREAVEKIAERDAFQQAKKSLRKQIKRIPKFGKQIKLRQAAIDKISEALEGVDIAKLSAAKKEDLSGIRNELKEVGFLIEKEFEVPSGEELEGIEAVVGERVVKQLQRLQKESIADMTGEEVEAIADAVRYALDQNTKETQERKRIKAERVRKQNEKALTEVTATKASAHVVAGERRTPVGLPPKVLGFFRQDSMKRWALVESATSEGLNTTAKVLDQDIHEGKTKAVDKQFDALEAIWAEMERVKWIQQDRDRADLEHTVTLAGREYELTTSEIMSLGMNVKSNRNAKQIVRTKGLWIGGRDVKTPTIGEIVDAMEVLTDKERAIMDFLPTLNEEILMPAMNEVSEDMLNFTLAKDPFYWGLKRKLPKKVRGRTIQGPAIEDIGAFQPFLGSKITLSIAPFWDQLLTQVQNASSLYGLAMPMENARTLLNNEQWQKTMDAAGRRREKENLITIFQRTQGVASDKDNVDIVGSTLLARAAKAILGWRISTMANQTASIPMAFTIIPDKYIAPVSGIHIQTGTEQSKRMDEYSPTLRMRHIGGRTSIVTGDAAARNAVDHLIFRQSADRSLQGMRHTDRFAIKTIDGFVQRWVADTTKLEFGSDAFWKEVARRSEEVVRKTQPMWDVDERSILGSIPNVLARSMFIFRSAREAVLNQNLMAIDRAIKAEDKKKALSRLTNTLAATTISTAMVVGIRKAMWVATGAVFAAITGRPRKKEEEPLAKGLGIDMIEASVEYLPLGRVIVGATKTALRQRTFDELDPDAILFGGPIAITRGMAHIKGAYEAYFEDGDEAKARKEILAAINDIADGIGRLKGYPTGGILQLTTQPLERALRQKEQKKYD